MCTNCRTIINRYTGRSVLVRCGHCESCLQEKALASANRIRNHNDGEHVNLFITLTYKNEFIPYVLLDDLYNFDGRDVNIYRDKSCRYYKGRLIVSDSKKPVGVFNDDTFLFSDADLVQLRSLSGVTGRVGVALYDDYKKFIKRLRQILIRDYGYRKGFSYYGCSEYGSITQRPHFHSLLSICKDDVEMFIEAVVKAWPYADSNRTRKFCEVARNAASYVASYVAGGHSLPALLQIPCFRQKHSMSKGYGTLLDCFSLPAILEKVHKGDCRVYREQKIVDSSQSVACTIPKYVINRYFPIFKGLRWLSASSLDDLLFAAASGSYESFCLTHWRFEQLPTVKSVCLGNMRSYVSILSRSLSAKEVHKHYVT